jgi:hypothetical protein
VSNSLLKSYSLGGKIALDTARFGLFPYLKVSASVPHS